MNFDYSDDQKFLKTEARKFLEGRCPISKVRAVLDDPARCHDADLWNEVAAQGWLGAAIPEAFNGLGLGVPERTGGIELGSASTEGGMVLTRYRF